jgi:hypothetical protein
MIVEVFFNLSLFGRLSGIRSLLLVSEVTLHGRYGALPCGAQTWSCRSCSDPAPLEFLRATCLTCGVCIIKAY